MKIGTSNIIKKRKVGKGRKLKMSENQIASVWYIDGNNLKHSNKVIVRLNYNGLDIAVLKEDLNYNYQEFLIKDSNNEYWALGIAPIKFKNFETVMKNPLAEEKTYCDDILKAYKANIFKSFFDNKIKNGKWFNKCELEYIYRYYPEIYDNAKNCREQIVIQRDKEKQAEEQKRIQHKKEEVEKTNTIFRKQLKEMKYKIFIGEDVPIDEFEFYKDDKYENGKTIQNSILYLAKEYGIKIPLATQGFINNRLVNYNFRTGEFAYKLTNNKKASVKMHEYLRQIFEKVKEEYKQLKKEREAR